ncbi:MAG: hypothetical protein L0177_01845 [Chloroflexi bacterium]|nr:hypothetical protein [Chloroflexota bacterium]
MFMGHDPINAISPLYEAEDGDSQRDDLSFGWLMAMFGVVSTLLAAIIMLFAFHS